MTAVAATYDARGPRDGPPIVFVHGTRLSRSAWTPQMDRLSGEFRTIALDLPGHGALAAVPFSLAGASEAVAAVIDEAAGGRATVVGLSLGGYVAMDIAARSADRVRGLILAGATAEPDGPAAIGYRSLAWAMETFDGERLDTLDRWFFETRFPAVISAPIVAGGFWSAGGAAALRALVGHRFRPRLSRHRGPTLIINGAWDPWFRVGSRAFARVAHGLDGGPAARVLLPRASHLSNLDQPAAFASAVGRFTRTLPPER